MGYTSNRLRFMLLMSLGASRSLRRLWFWGCVIILALSIGLISIPFESPATSGPRDNPYAVAGLLTAWVGICGLFVWCLAQVIRFFGKQIKDDYRADRLFERRDRGDSGVARGTFRRWYRGVRK